MNKILHILFTYRFSLFLQTAIAISFLYLLIKINISIDNTNEVLKKELVRAKDLHKVLENLETEEYLNLKKNKTSFDTTKSDVTEAKTKSIQISAKNNLSDPSGNLISAKGNDTKIDTQKNTKDIAPVLNNKIEERIYQFDKQIILGAGVEIISVTAKVYIYGDAPYGQGKVKAELRMTSTDDEDGSRIKYIKFQCAKSEIDNNNILNCLFRQIPLNPNRDVFDPSNHDFNIGLSLKGPIENNVIDCIMVWEDITGRPLNAKFKIPLLK